MLPTNARQLVGVFTFAVLLLCLFHTCVYHLSVQLKDVRIARWHPFRTQLAFCTGNHKVCLQVLWSVVAFCVFVCVRVCARGGGGGLYECYRRIFGCFYNIICRCLIYKFVTNMPRCTFGLREGRLTWRSRQVNTHVELRARVVVFLGGI